MPKSKKLLMAYPATIAAVVVVMFMMLSMSPAMDGVLLKSASAYTITWEDGNYLSEISCFGKLRSDASSDTTNIAQFQVSSLGAATFTANSLLRTTGYINQTSIWFSSAGAQDIDAYLASLGYGRLNFGEFKDIINITMSITNPNSATTYIYPLDHITVQYPVSDGSWLIDDSMYVVCNVPDYTFSVEGTYTIGYTYSVYY